jgi:hypothetical protein
MQTGDTETAPIQFGIKIINLENSLAPRRGNNVNQHTTRC